MLCRRIGIVRVHRSCPKDFTNKRRHEQQQCRNTDTSDDPAVKFLRSTVDIFNWKHDCFLCGQNADTDVRHPERNRVCVVETLEMREYILSCCTGRTDDKTLQVQGRLNACCDLVAEEAVYHRNCTTDCYRNYSYQSWSVAWSCFWLWVAIDYVG